MVTESDEASFDLPSEKVIQRMDLLYPFAVILFMLSFFDLSGALAILSVITAIIVKVLEIRSDAMTTIINLLINLIAQISSITIFVVLSRSNRVEPEEKSMPTGNFLLTTYLVYSLLIAFTFILEIINSLLESLGLPEKSPYEAIEPRIDLLDNPIFYILFFGTLVFGAAIWEELAFRRTFIPFLERRGMGTFWALAISSLLFSLMHTPVDLLSGSLRFAIVHFFSTFAGGCALGFLYMRTRNILWPILLHGLVNGVAGVAMIGLVRWDELNDISLVTLSGLWVLTALAVGAGTAAYAIIQLIRYRSSANPPAWFRILTDFNIRPSRLLPVSLIALGFVGLEGGIPIIFDFIFQLLGDQSQEFAVFRYLIEIIYLGGLIMILSFFVYKKAGPLKEPDWVSDLTFPEPTVSSYPHDYIDPQTGFQSFCGSCRREIVPNSKFCVYCGTKIEFEAAEGKFDDERVRELLISTTPAATSKSFRLDELTKQQRSLIRDLQEGKALPHSKLVSAFNVSDFEVTFTIQSYLPGDTYLTRITDLYRLVSPAGTCQVCQQTTKDIPYFQCNSCYRYLCQEHYNVVKQIGYPVCPECEGNLVALPIQCKGCGITFLDLGYVKNIISCQYCNYQLQTPDISHLKPSSLSTDQIKEISDLRDKIPDDEKKQDTEK